MNDVSDDSTLKGKNWITKRDIAAHLQCTTRTIEKMMRGRVLPYIKIGRIVRFDLADCDQALVKFRRRCLSDQSGS